MIVSETIYVDGEPIGVIRQDITTKQIDFSPIKSPSKLPQCDWRGVDQLRVAIDAAYKNTGKDHE